MWNLIGTLPETSRVLAVHGAHLHLYGKAPRPGRKVGHVTVWADTESERDERLAGLRARPGLRLHKLLRLSFVLLPSSFVNSPLLKNAPF
jgi:hypothetical protein